MAHANEAAGILSAGILREGTRAFRRSSRPSRFAALVALAATVAAIYIYSGCCITLRLPIRSDGYGYYAYLTSVFIDHDLSMKTAMANRWTGLPLPAVAPEWNGIARYAPTGRLIDKYTMGTALLQAPFFLAAEWYATVTRNAPYSAPYQIANVISGIVFLWLGAWVLARALIRQFSPFATALAAACVIFGTSLFHDATFIGSFSHVYSFFLFALLVHAADRYRGAANNAQAAQIPVSLGLGCVIGLIALTRVPNAVAALIPLAMLVERFRKTGNYAARAIEALAGVVAFACVFGLQIAYWYAVTGHLLLNSYQGEHFDWLHPHLLQFLFSVRRGLFLWSPVLWIAILGLPRFVRRDGIVATAFLVVLVLEVYICSCWWSWWFGASFGSRPVADMMPLVAFPLAHGLDALSARFDRKVSAATVLVLVAFSLFLMLSYWKEYIPWDNPTAGDLLRLPGWWVMQIGR